MTKKQAKKKPKDWEKIAKLAFPLLLRAVEKLKPNGWTSIFNRRTGKSRAWQVDYFTVMEMYGVKLDREWCYACQLPRRELQKWIKKNRPDGKPKIS